jgi:hypothetical protein
MATATRTSRTEPVAHRALRGPYAWNSQMGVGAPQELSFYLGTFPNCCVHATAL